MEHKPDNGQAGVEVTPEMIEAGVDELCIYDWERDDPREIVLRIMKAVLGADAVTVHEIKKVGSQSMNFIRNSL